MYSVCLTHCVLLFRSSHPRPRESQSLYFIRSRDLRMPYYSIFNATFDCPGGSLSTNTFQGFKGPPDQPNPQENWLLGSDIRAINGRWAEGISLHEPQTVQVQLFLTNTKRNILGYLNSYFWKPCAYLIARSSKSFIYMLMYYMV